MFSVKKSSVPDVPVKEIDPSNTHIDIKQDIREDIVGSNGTAARYKEGVKKLLDFLKAGALDDDKQSDTPNQAPIISQSNSSQETQRTETSTKSYDSIESSVAKIIVQMDKLRSNKSNPHVNVPVDKTSLMGNSSKPNAILPQDNITTMFNLPDPALPAVPVGAQLPLTTSSNEAPVTPKYTSDITSQQTVPASKTLKGSASPMMTSHHTTSPVTSQQNSFYAKSQIPYGISLNLPSAVYGQQPIVKKNRIPYSTAYHPYQPYTATGAYQRSPLPYGWYNTKRYNIPLHPSYQHYPYRPAVVRSKLPLPLYHKPYPAYHTTYTRHYVPSHFKNIYQSPWIHKPAMSNVPGMRLSTVPHALASQRSQIAHASFYRHPAMLWSAVPRPLSYPVKYRRMAISGRGKAYTGLKSPREKVAQKTPLPLPLASIMTAARIVVPARPNTLNGALKSSVETLQSEDAEEKSAKAV